MVKVKEGVARAADGKIDVDQWIEHLVSQGYFQNMDLIRHACALSQLAGQHATETGESCFQQGLAMADVLASLEIDQETIAAAIVFEGVHYAELSLEVIEEQLGVNVAKLVSGVENMSAISTFQTLNKELHKKHQIDNVRKMLLAMVDDVRVVLIKLAERLCMLRSVAPMPIAMREQLAKEVMEIYAPLANRLGIGAIKWELEDLAFRYLQPETYKTIAKGLNAKRLEREHFVAMIVDILNERMRAMGIEHFAVYGRAKHIHSIHRKMQRKHVALNEIYDAIAVRVLVDTTEQCYEILSLVHTLWQRVPKEFDDYISNPKGNGYQSLHTAVTGPEDRVFEVQLRTFRMHEQAEMGLAAHWKYKEGGVRTKETHERKIEWLREVLAWHHEMAINKGVSEVVETHFLDDRVYVFTPDGDVLDLAREATVLDFAYHVHTSLGHRCRGAKVNNHIAPLTYVLKTGDKVEVLTGKEAKPSRDWINPHLHYLHTPRAKAKVLHWFKMQDYDKHKTDGRELLEKELKILGLKLERLQELVASLKFKTLDDLFAAVGRGDVKSAHVINRLTPLETVELPSLKLAKPPSSTGAHGDVRIEGVGDLLTHMARCCQPVPGDVVVGYITVGRGVSIHRQDCTNVIHANEKQRQRFLEVSWGDATREQYIVSLLIKAFDRPGLLRDITALLTVEKAHVFELQTQTDRKENITCLMLTIDIDGLNSLSRLITRLLQVPNVLEARRQT